MQYSIEELNNPTWQLNNPYWQFPTWAKEPEWCADEKWEYFERLGKIWVRVTGRKPCPESLKKDWRWWIQNDFEEQVQDWYQPNWPTWRRELYWNYFRNPLQNYRCFVIGVCDQNYEVEVLEGHPSPFIIQRDDIRETGYQKTRIHLQDGCCKDFVSYSSQRLKWYNGWQATGIHGIKFNLKF